MYLKNAKVYLFIYRWTHHVVTCRVIDFIWGIERITTVSVSNVYSTFISDGSTLNLATYNNSKLFSE